MFRYAAFVLIGGAQLAALIAGWDSWPVTNYPMFAENKTLSEASVFRLTVHLGERSVDVGNNGRPNWEEYQAAHAANDWGAIRDLALAEVPRENGGRWQDGEVTAITVSRVALAEPFAEGRITQRKILDINPRTKEFHVHGN